MRVAELSRRSGVPLATIKFYLRAGLLHPGRALDRNQASYDDSHLRRLALIRALREVAELSVARIRSLVTALDAEDPHPGYLPMRTVDALGPVPNRRAPGSSPPEAESEIDALLAALGWEVRADAPARGLLVDAFVALREFLDPALPTEALLPYAALADGLAKQEIGIVAEQAHPDRASEMRAVAMGTILWERVLIALRRLAHERHARAREHTADQPSPE